MRPNCDRKKNVRPMLRDLFIHVHALMVTLNQNTKILIENSE